jgi:hypothetical protein
MGRQAKVYESLVETLPGVNGELYLVGGVQRGRNWANSGRNQLSKQERFVVRLRTNHDRTIVAVPTDHGRVESFRIGILPVSRWSLILSTKADDPRQPSVRCITSAGGGRNCRWA